MDPQLRRAALEYHETGAPGKIAIAATKSLTNQRDLALAYSPGVAAACEEIVADPAAAFRYTARANLVAVVSNGTAVLGLGNIGPLASKPVMEGKAVLFKKFAGIDVFDLEIAETDPERLVEIIAALEPTFGGINLEDIKAPDCFRVERELRKRLRIPVFHDDQHGTAIVVGAALLNALRIARKGLEEIKVVVSGAGAAALACLDLLVEMGLPLGSIWVTDLAGVVYRGRTELMDEDKARFAQATEARTLAEVIAGADVFLGLSAGGVLKQDMVARMAARPIVFALANPNPEILPEDVKAVRDDAIIATGRTDYPNQVNNVLCFPFIFRGALDVGATTINREMEVAAVQAVAGLAREEQSDVVTAAYGAAGEGFGPEYLIPKPFDPRLIARIAPAVARAAMDSGVATRPITDFDAYRVRLEEFVYHSGNFMKPIFAAARRDVGRRIVYTEGEEERVLRAVQVVIDEKLARPIVVGRPAVLEKRIERFGLRVRPGVDFEVVNPEWDERYRSYWQAYHQLTERQGVTAQYAKIEMRRRLTLIGAMMLRQGDADGMLCGTFGTVPLHLHYIEQVIGRRPGASVYATMNTLMLPGRQISLVDTHVNVNPDAAQLAQITLMAVEELRRVGILPKVALLSHSNFGTSNAGSAPKMREALRLIREQAPELEVDGEMHGDLALDAAMRSRSMPRSSLSGPANLLVLPDIDSANIAYNLLKTAAGNNVAIGPVLLGAARPVHVLTASATVRRIVNMTAWTVVDANSERRHD
ncbi:MAG: NADP-dependent malic enzyme [Burkholderiaceae bacterium]|nr:NADP-dependent malic enzyme [Burkholderiaceae bacterium]